MAFLNIEGRSVAYRLLGAEANPLVVLSHPLGMSQAVWDDVLPALEDIGHPVVDGPVASARQTAIVQVLRDRAAARANSDFQAWLASYSDHFTPADGQSRADWLTAVRKTFDEPGKPGGPIEDVRVVFNAPDRAHASYRQPGHAGSVIRHAVAFVQEDGQWRIVSQRESALGFETL